MSGDKISKCYCIEFLRLDGTSYKKRDFSKIKGMNRKEIEKHADSLRDMGVPCRVLIEKTVTSYLEIVD